MAEIFDWDVIAGNNNSAPPDGFPEGQTPASLNNSAREVMAVIARYYEVFNGGLATTGSGGNYILSVNQTISAYATGQFFSFTANHDNTGATTLNVNAVGAAAVTGPDGSDLLPGVIRNGGVYSVTYTGTAFILHAANINLPPNTVYYPWNFDASGDDQTSVTWNKPAGLKRARISVTAGGGGGESGRSTQGGSGAASRTAIAVFDAADLGASESVLIGRGGAGATALVGAPYAEEGFDSAFGALITVNGGGRAGNGTDAAASAPGAVLSASVDPSAVSSIITPGAPGMNGLNNTDANIFGPQGGISIYGGPGIGSSNVVGGPQDARGYGSGGGGGIFVTVGSDGGPGLVIIEEFF